MKHYKVRYNLLWAGKVVTYDLEMDINADSHEEARSRFWVRIAGSIDVDKYTGFDITGTMELE